MPNLSWGSMLSRAASPGLRRAAAASAARLERGLGSGGRSATRAGIIRPPSSPSGFGGGMNFSRMHRITFQFSSLVKDKY